MLSRFAEKLSVKVGRLAAMPGFQFRKAEGLPTVEVIQTPYDLVEQGEMDMLSLEAMIVVQPVRIDERSTAFAVLGDDSLVTFGADFIDQLA